MKTLCRICRCPCRRDASMHHVTTSFGAPFDEVLPLIYVPDYASVMRVWLSFIQVATKTSQCYCVRTCSCMYVCMHTCMYACLICQYIWRAACSVLRLHGLASHRLWFRHQTMHWLVVGVCIFVWTCSGVLTPLAISGSGSAETRKDRPLWRRCMRDGV